MRVETPPPREAPAAARLSARRPAADAQAEGVLPPDRLRAAFDAALRQAAKSSRPRPGAAGDEGGAVVAAAPSFTVPLSLPAAAATPPAAAGAVAEPCAVTQHLRALDVPAAAAASAPAGRWHLRLADSTLCVQGLDVLRMAAGHLQVVVLGLPEKLKAATLDRLALRLQQRGSTARIVTAHDDAAGPGA